MKLNQKDKTMNTGNTEAIIFNVVTEGAFGNLTGTPNPNGTRAAMLDEKFLKMLEETPKGELQLED